MKLKQVLDGIAGHFDRLLSEMEPEKPRVAAPERSMASEKPRAHERGLVVERPRPRIHGTEFERRVTGASLLAQLRKSLRQRDAVRQAIVLKEVLDKPLARRRR